VHRVGVGQEGFCVAADGPVDDDLVAGVDLPPIRFGGGEVAGAGADMSNPIRRGRAAGSVPKRPRTIFPSMGFTPAARTSTTACPGPGGGIAASTGPTTCAGSP
jgi:hypothetical protein